MRLYICALMLFGIMGVVPVGHAQSGDSNTSIQDVSKESQEFLQTIGSYTADKREDAVRVVADGLYKVDQRLDALETRMDKNWEIMSDAARKEARDNFRDLRKQRNQVAEWYGRMINSSADAWDEMKKGFSKAYRDLESAWEKSEKELSSSE
jgi:hypothetical protein